MKWPQIRLDECTRIVSGATPKTEDASYWGGSIHWVTPKDLSDNEGIHISKTARTLTPAGVASCSTEILPENTVLFSSRAPIGHVAINTVPMCTNQGFKSFVPEATKLDSRYLYFWLRANRTYLDGLGTGATFKELSKATISKVTIPLPSLEEQKRIADILDAADALRAKRRRALTRLDDLARALFLHHFGDPVSNPKDWPVVPLENLLSEIESGKSPVCLDRPADETEWGVLKLGAVTRGDFASEENKALPPDVAPDTRHEVKAGDLLFSRKNTYEHVAAVSLVRSTRPRLLLPDLIFRLCIKPNAGIISDYLFGVMAHPEKRSCIQQLAGGAAASMPNISKAKLMTVPIPVPPLELQRRFAVEIAAVASLKAKHRAGLANLDALFASLQDRSFSGRL